MSGILDTRDLQKRLDELESWYDDLKTAVDEAEEALKTEEEPDDDLKQEFVDAREALEEFEESDEFKELKELTNMSEEISEWRHGETLIPVDDWEDYVRDLVEEAGYISKDFPGWIEIDWTKTAENVSQDYSLIDYQGETYYYRNS